MKKVQVVVLFVVVFIISSCVVNFVAEPPTAPALEGWDLQVSAAELASYTPATVTISSKWAKEINVENVLPEYPRPQLVRKNNWKSLNGLWDYAIVKKEEKAPKNYAGKILVPFAVESSLSGVGKKVGIDNRLWYRLKFKGTKVAPGKKVLLHFGSVDFEATVWLNGVELGSHKGGHTPFSFDITNALTAGDQQELVVAVWDPSDFGYIANGKQFNRANRIFYSTVTGIWQSVWVEEVNASHITDLKILPDLDNSTLKLTVHSNEAAAKVQVTVYDAGSEVVSTEGTVGAELALKIKNVKTWSPDKPFLYDLKVTLTSNESQDEVSSYFAMRKISLQKDKAGINRLFLNGQVLFHYGPLDQGWWPAGLYTAPTDEALRFDIVKAKKFGFNMIRKHIKVEPERFYYHCDKLGMLVWQDMPSLSNWYPNIEKEKAESKARVKYPNLDEYHAKKKAAKKKFKRDRAAFLAASKKLKEEYESKPNYEQQLAAFDKEKKTAFDKIQELMDIGRVQFEVELKEMIDTRFNNPCIVMWIPFNESWGQYDTQRITKWIKQYDSSRLVNNASGWHDKNVGDVRDIHKYPGPEKPKNEENRAVVLGEFGGVGLAIKGHRWRPKKRNFSYVKVENKADFTKKYRGIITTLRSLVEEGLAAAVYTQITDVETEDNGIMTYDRAIDKMDEKDLYEMHQVLYTPVKYKE